MFRRNLGSFDYGLRGVPVSVFNIFTMGMGMGGAGRAGAKTLKKI